MRIINKLTQLVLGLSIPLVLLTGTISLITSSTYLSYEYRKASFPPDSFGFTPDERFDFAQSALTYVKDPLPIEFLATQTIDGQPLYNERELSHMVDVQNVFRFAWSVSGVAVILLLTSAVWLLAASNQRIRVARAMEISGISTAVTLFTLGFLAMIGWDTWFTAFHQVFFVPGSWMFSPSDTLIRLFPIQFWFDSALTVVGLTLIGGLVTALAGYLLRTRILNHSSVRKETMSIKQHKIQTHDRKEWPLSIYGWMVSMAFAGYFIGIFVFGETSHPLHWASAGFGLVLGGWVGWLLIYWKESRAKHRSWRP